MPGTAKFTRSSNHAASVCWPTANRLRIGVSNSFPSAANIGTFYRNFDLCGLDFRVSARGRENAWFLSFLRFGESTSLPRERKKDDRRHSALLPVKALHSH